MTTISHKNLSGSQLHENKGVAAAADNTVATASSGATIWQKLEPHHLNFSADSFGGKLLHATYTVSQNTSDAAGSSNTWVTRRLNTLNTNEISGASLNSNLITLPAGTYCAIGVAPTTINTASTNPNNSFLRARLFNATDSSVIKLGRQSPTACLGIGSTIITFYALSMDAEVWAPRFTLASSKEIALQTYVKGTGSPWQNALTMNVSGESEVYNELMIWKLS